MITTGTTNGQIYYSGNTHLEKVWMKITKDYKKFDFVIETKDGSKKRIPYITKVEMFPMDEIDITYIREDIFGNKLFDEKNKDYSYDTIHGVIECILYKE